MVSSLPPYQENHFVNPAPANHSCALDQLKGNKQAADVADGIGSIGGLKKQL